MIYRRYRMPARWQEMERLQREMNRIFNTMYPTRYEVAPSFPAVNLWVNEGGLVVTSEVPGIKPENMDISVVNEMLTISGERPAEQIEGEARYHRQERGCGKFARTIQLPFAVDANRVEATFSNGVLQISLPRKEEDKPKKIKVVTK